MRDDDFAQFIHRKDCPMPEEKQCHTPGECDWDWACAIDRALVDLDTTSLVIRRQTSYYSVQKGS